MPSGLYCLFRKSTKDQMVSQKNEKSVVQIIALKMTKIIAAIPICEQLTHRHNYKELLYPT